MQSQAFEDKDTSIMAGLIGALPQSVLIVSGEPRVIAANAAAHALLPGLRQGDLLARSLRAPDVLDAIQHVQTTGEAERVTWNERVPVERLYEISIAPFDQPNGKPLIALTLMDLTAQRHLERMRVDFVANASHELRTPLASLMGFVETLQGPARDDAVARVKFLDIMRDQARRMARLIDDLLSLSRIEQNLHIHPEAAVDLTAVLYHVVDTLRPMAEDNKVTLNVDAAAPVIVAGDRDELFRVAENLVENAIKYGASDTEPTMVDIKIEANGGQGVLRVRDHGRGIAPEHLPRLTERFYRVDAGKSRAKGGTGLGLALCKHIIARHRGRLTVESQLGQGATFTVTLPLKNA